MVWVGLLIGVSVRSPDAVMGIGFTVVFPLTFVASTFVPVAGLPDGAAAVRRVESDQRPRRRRPRASSATRRRSRTTPPGRSRTRSLYSLAWTAAILAVCVPLTVHRFRARTSS